MPPLKIFEDKGEPGDWRVEVNDADGDGACEVTIFGGHRAEEREPRRMAKSSKNSKVVTSPANPASKAAIHPHARPG